MKLSIVTGTRNRPDSYLRFITSVFNTVPISIDYEIVVGDANDCPPEESYTQTQAPQQLMVGMGSEPPIFREIHVYYQRPRLGMNKGYNHSFSQCKGKYVAWFNDDVECLKGWAEAAVEYMDANPEVGCGAIYFLDRATQKYHHSGPVDDLLTMKPIERTKRGWNSMFCLQTLYNLFYANFGIVRKEVGDKVGWFSKDIGRAGVDNDICAKIMLEGYAIGGIEKSKVLHWRDRDEERDINRTSLPFDRELFDKKWVPYIDKLQSIQNRFSHYLTPKVIG